MTKIHPHKHSTTPLTARGFVDLLMSMDKVTLDHQMDVWMASERSPFRAKFLQQALSVAVESGLLVPVKTILELGAKADGPALLQAIERHDLFVAKALLSSTPKLVHYRDPHSEGQTPLYKAIGLGDSHMAIMLISYHPKINEQNEVGYTPLHFTLELLMRTEEHRKIAHKCTHYYSEKLFSHLKARLFPESYRSLVSCGENLDTVAVRMAKSILQTSYPGEVHVHTTPTVSDASEPFFAVLAERLLGSFQSEEQALPTRNVCWSILRHQKVIERHFDFPAIALELCHKGTDLSLQDKRGHTPLHLAIKAGKVDLVEEMLKRHASPHTPDALGCSPLMNAVINTTKETYRTSMAMVQLLLHYGANPAHPGNTISPLTFATQSGFFGMAAMMQASLDRSCPKPEPRMTALEEPLQEMMI